jgi:hypothetical protein
MEHDQNNKMPEFTSLEEEKAYWEARGPLAAGRKGRLNKPKAGQKKSSFLAVRLTGEELTRLRTIAANQGIGPSTFARLVLSRAIENAGRQPRSVTVDELKNTLANTLPQSVREKAEAFDKEMTIDDPENPSLVIIDANQKKAIKEFAVSWLAAVFAIANVQMVTPRDVEYGSIKSAVKSQQRVARNGTSRYG